MRLMNEKRRTPWCLLGWWVLLYALQSQVLYAHEETVGAVSVPLRLATASDFVPYAYRLANGEWTGIDVEIVHRIFEELDIPFKIVDLPRKRITLMLQEGVIDGLVSTSAYQIEEMLQQMWLSSEIYSSEVSLFARADTIAIDPEQLLSANQELRLGMLSEFTSDLRVKNQLPEKQILRVLRDEQLVNLMKIGRIDLAISEDIAFIYQARKIGYFDQVKPVAELASRASRFALVASVKERFPDLPDKINHRIEHLLSSGVIDDVIVSYLTLGPQVVSSGPAP